MSSRQSPISSSAGRIDDETEPCPYDYCDTEIPTDSTHRFCSSECAHRNRAHGLLKTIYYDHRFCANCYRRLKHVYPPARLASSSEIVGDVEDGTATFRSSVPDCAIGRAYYLPHTESGERERIELHKTSPWDNGAEFAITDDVDIRPTCSCGAAHNKTVDRPVSFDRLKEFAKHLSETLDELLREDTISETHDRQTLLTRVCELKTDPDNSSPDQELLIIALSEAIRAAP